MVDRFEAIAYEHIPERGGRVVKMIGDEVMFAADDGALAADIAVALVEAYARDADLPGRPRRPRQRTDAGVGRRSLRPDRQSREPLVNLARPNTVLVSDELGAQLRHRPALRASPSPTGATCRASAACACGCCGVRKTSRQTRNHRDAGAGAPVARLRSPRTRNDPGGAPLDSRSRLWSLKGALPMQTETQSLDEHRAHEAPGRRDGLTYDPSLPQARLDPYPTYRELRDRAPVHWAEQTRVWCVSRYEDVMFVLKNPEIFSSRAMFTFLMNQGREGRPPLSWSMLTFLVRFVWRTRLNPLEFATARNLIAEDGDRHAAMRRIVNRGFTPQRIAAREPRVRELVAQCMAKLDAPGSFDLIEDLAIPVPVGMIAEMLGVEPERRADFKRWSDAIIANTTGPGRGDPFNPRFVDSIIELINYLRGIAAQRRRRPAEDLISAIVAEQDGDNALDGARGRAVRDAAARRRKRDDDEPDRKRGDRSAGSSRPARARRRGSEPGSRSRRGDAALRCAGPDGVSNRDARRGDRRDADRQGKLRRRSDRVGQSRRATVRRSGPLRRDAKARKVTSASDSVDTSVSAPRWRASKRGLRSRRWCRACIGSSVRHRRRWSILFWFADRSICCCGRSLERRARLFAASVPCHPRSARFARIPDRIER